MQYKDRNNNIVQITSLPYILDNDYKAGQLHPITFIPAPNTYNEPNPTFPHPNINGQYSELYCKVVYTVLDDTFEESDPQTIDISIQEKNDVPTCIRDGNPKCNFLNQLGNTSGDANFIYMFSVVEMYEDEELWLYVNFIDIEHDFYIPHILECDDDNGKFFYPKVASQANHFNLGGEITNMAGLRATTANLLDCQPFSDFPFVSLLNSSFVNEKGYYLRFVPDANEFGNLYNKIGILVQDDPSGQSSFLVMYYFITVLPVNDRPTIHLNSFNGGNPVLAQNNEIVQFSVFNGYDLLPIHHVEDNDTVTGVPSMTVEISFDSATLVVSALDINGDPISLTSGSPFRYTGSLFQVDRTLSNLKINSANEGNFDVKVYLNDNGATGNCPPQNGQGAVNNGACPQETRLTIRVNVSNTNSISGPLSIGTTAGIGLFLIGGIVAGVLVIRKMKDKKVDSWVEFDENNFNDVAGINPLFEQRSRSMSNPLYVSSRESEIISEI
jgi:hypothetical protein